MGPMQSNDNVFELRQYTLRGGQRETLITLFEKHFIEPQDAVGAHVIGIFRDLDDPDRFVWIRGFHDMALRRQALESFYGGPVWQANRQAANATMIDSDNVLLLRAAAPGQGLTSTSARAAGLFGVDIYYLDTTPTAEFAQFFDTALLLRYTTAGARVLARLATEEARNDFRLPVREHERTYVCVARWPSVEAHDEFVRRDHARSGWRDHVPETILPALMRKPERLRLTPTERSPLQ
jgi:hypothetical protein